MRFECGRNSQPPAHRASMSQAEPPPTDRELPQRARFGSGSGFVLRGNACAGRDVYPS